MKFGLFKFFAKMGVIIESKRMKTQVFVILVFSFFSLNLLAKSADRITIESNGLTRSYLAYVPEGLAEKSPVLVALHGGMGSAEQAMDNFQLNAVAEKNKFIVLYPDGTSVRLLKRRHVWNAGKCCGLAAEKKIEDNAFINSVVQDASKRFSIDSAQVFITGMSNGAMMSYRILCETPDLFAGVIPVAGTIAVEPCDKGKDKPVLHIHGMKDEHVPYLGGVGFPSGVRHRSIPETMEMLMKHRDCGKPVESQISKGVKKLEYFCKMGANVTLILADDLEHVWPKTSVVANEYIWNFMKALKKK